ncbi:tripartite tricarboxylate transporter TctB family protein [Litorisediminicola beolgyonensis]|uniref:Tripartite tricarboxylate transporter TctB family protein n=1 Tax=Litorisediminicola beolgyonensis TaxID=1173614 RepID=A0ABW3ZJK7_9RHOB
MPSDTEDRQPDPHANGLGWGGEIGGVLLFLLSIIFMVGGWQLGLGQPTRLGTGAFPFVTGAVLAALSVFICVAERKGDGLAEVPDWVGLAAIAASLAVFAISVEPLGLVPGVFATVMVASLPDRSLSFPGKALLGVVVALGCWGVFIELLNLPFKPFVGM